MNNGYGGFLEAYVGEVKCIPSAADRMRNSECSAGVHKGEASDCNRSRVVITVINEIGVRPEH